MSRCFNGKNIWIPIRVVWCMACLCIFGQVFLALSQKLVQRLEIVRPSQIKLEFGRSVVSIGLTIWILDTKISGFHMFPEFGPPESECSLYIKGSRDEHAQVLVSKTYSEWKHPFYNIRCLWLTSLFGKTRLGWDKFPDRSTWPYPTPNGGQTYAR